MITVGPVRLAHKVCFNYQSWEFDVTVHDPEGHATTEELTKAATDNLRIEMKEYCMIDAELASCIDLARHETIQVADKLRAKLKL